MNPHDYDQLANAVAQSENNHPRRLLDSLLTGTPSAPVGWRAPGPFDLDDEQRKELRYVTLARAVWKAGRGYLIQHLWDIYHLQKYILGPYEAEVLQRRRAKERERWALPGEYDLPEPEIEDKPKCTDPVPIANAHALLSEIAAGRVMSGMEGHMHDHDRTLVNLPLWAVKAAFKHAGYGWPRERR